MRGPDTEDGLGQTLENLRTRYPDVPHDVLRSEVERAEAGFAGATVQDFLPVLIEREVRSRLRTGPIAVVQAPTAVGQA